MAIKGQYQHTFREHFEEHVLRNNRQENSDVGCQGAKEKREIGLVQGSFCDWVGQRIAKMDLGKSGTKINSMLMLRKQANDEYKNHILTHKQGTEHQFW